MDFDPEPEPRRVEACLDRKLSRRADADRSAWITTRESAKADFVPS